MQKRNRFPIEEFQKMKERQPLLSSYIVFCRVVRGGNFPYATLSRWMKKWVEKDDYAPKDKETLLKSLVQ